MKIVDTVGRKMLRRMRRRRLLLLRKALLRRKILLLLEAKAGKGMKRGELRRIGRIIAMIEALLGGEYAQ